MSKNRGHMPRGQEFDEDLWCNDPMDGLYDHDALLGYMLRGSDQLRGWNHNEIGDPVLVRLLRSDPTGSGRTEGRTRSRVRRTAIDCPHQNACREDENETRGDLRRPEPNRSFRAFRRNLRERRGEISNISSGVLEYKYTRYIY